MLYLSVCAKSLPVHCMGTPLSHVLRFTAVMPSLLNTHPPSGGNGFTDSNCSRNDGQASHAVMPHSFLPPSSRSNDLTEQKKRKKRIVKRTPPYKNQEDKKEKNKR